MYRFLVLALLAAVGAASHSPLRIEFGDSRIVGGRPTPISRIPYQVSLQSNYFHFCGGSIYNEKYVITAGHCAGHAASAMVRAGSSVTHSGGSLHKVVWVKRHENFTAAPTGEPHNDIAILRVSPPFNLDESRAPVSLYYSSEDIEDGQVGLVSGYGRIEEGGGPSAALMAVEVPIVNREKCDKIYKKLGFGGVQEDFICAGTDEGGKDSCQGDSGGPVVVKGQLAGIVSYGLGCARPGIPGVYANVAHFVKWISDNTSD